MKRAAFALLACLTLGWTYRGILQEFAWNDDFTNLYQFAGGPDAVLVARWSAHMTSEGRPLYAPLQALLFTPLRGVADLAFVRLAGWSGVLVFACLLYRRLRQGAWPALTAGCAALTACATPGLEVLVCWASVAPYPWGLVLAFAAGELALDVHGSRLRRAAVVSVSALAQLAALMIYQSTAMGFLLPLAIEVEDRRCHRPRRSGGGLGWSAWLFSGTLGLYMVWYKSGLWPFQPSISERATLSPLHCLPLWPRYWVDATALTALTPPALRYGVAIGVSLVLMAGWWRQGFSRWALAGACLVPLVFLPCLMSPCWGVRTHAVLGVLVVIYLFSILDHARLPRAALVVLALASLALASTNIMQGFVLPKQSLLARWRARVRLETAPDTGAWFFRQAHTAFNPDYPQQEFSSTLVGAGEWNCEYIIPVLLQEVDGRRHRLWVTSSRHANPATFPHVLDEEQLVLQVRGEH